MKHAKLILAGLTASLILNGATAVFADDTADENTKEGTTVQQAAERLQKDPRQTTGDEEDNDLQEIDMSGLDLPEGFIPFDEAHVPDGLHAPENGELKPIEFDENGTMIFGQKPDGEMPPMNGERPGQPGGKMPPMNGETPELPDGELPELPDGEMPAMNGERPELPDGEMPPMNGERPELPDGELPELPDGEMPSMNSERPELPDGELPELPDGEMPSMNSGMQERPAMNGWGPQGMQQTQTGQGQT